MGPQNDSRSPNNGQSDGEAENRSLTAIAYGKASQVGSISTGLIVPGLAGYWADTQWGTAPLFTLIGFGIGFSWMIYQLVQLGAGPKKTTKSADEDVSR